MLKLVIANKRYSSWSMRPWLVMRAFNVPFEEIVVPLRRPESAANVIKYSPSGKVPALMDDGGVVAWESLSIIEYVADKFSEHPVWPRDAKARAHARSASNEMHSGFQALRAGCPMDICARYERPDVTNTMAQNIMRIEDIWAEARGQFGSGGPFLYGQFCAADAMYAPVVSRFATYQIAVRAETAVYMRAVENYTPFAEWRAAALKEPWVIPDYAAGHKLVESYL